MEESLLYLILCFVAVIIGFIGILIIGLIRDVKQLRSDVLRVLNLQSSLMIQKFERVEANFNLNEDESYEQSRQLEKILNLLKNLSEEKKKNEFEECICSPLLPTAFCPRCDGDGD